MTDISLPGASGRSPSAASGSRDDDGARAAFVVAKSSGAPDNAIPADADADAGRDADAELDVNPHADAEFDLDTNPHADAGRDTNPHVDAGRDVNPDADADARALASTVRLRILRLCLDESLTNKEIAAALGRNPATVLHHVRTLVGRGFLRAEPERVGARGAREVPYRATGKSWNTPLPPSGRRVLVDTFLEELAEADPDKVEVGRLGMRLDAEGRTEFLDRLDALLTEFKDRPQAPGAEPWSLFVAFHHEPSRERRDTAGGSSDVGEA